MRELTGRRRQGEVRSLDGVEAVGAVNASEAWRWQSVRAEAGRGTWQGDSSLVATCSSSTWRGEGGADPGVGSSNDGGGVPVIHGRETMRGGEETRWGKEGEGRARDGGALAWSTGVGKGGVMLEDELGRVLLSLDQTREAVGALGVEVGDGLVRWGKRGKIWIGEEPEVEGDKRGVAAAARRIPRNRVWSKMD